jgi:hypothetical protein
VSNYKDALKEVIQIYNKAGFQFAGIRSDNNSDHSKFHCFRHLESELTLQILRNTFLKQNTTIKSSKYKFGQATTDYLSNITPKQ